MKLRGRIALITGASRNDGRATALALAEEGGDVVLTTRKSQGALDVVAQEVRSRGVRALPLLADMTDARVMREVVGRAEDELGKVDILINNAVDRGLRAHTPFLEMSHTV